MKAMREGRKEGGGRKGIEGRADRRALFVHLLLLLEVHGIPTIFVQVTSVFVRLNYRRDSDRERSLRGVACRSVGPLSLLMLLPSLLRGCVT